MATRSANVIARVEPEVKEQAEDILNQIGIPVSTAINMLYREIILWKGLPFRPSIPAAGPKAVDELSKEEFDSMMAIGLAQATEMTCTLNPAFFMLKQVDFTQAVASAPVI